MRRATKGAICAGATPSVTSGMAFSTRTDTTRDTTLALDWQPHTSVTLSASLQDARRTSTFAGLDFQSTQTTVSARFAY